MSDFYSGILKDGLLPWQLEAMSIMEHKKADILLLSGGVGSGKTAVNAHIARNFLFKRNRVGICIAVTYSMLKDTVAVTLDKECGSLFIKTKKYSSPLSWIFKSEGGSSKLISRVMRFDHEVPARLKSINADMLWMVEATELPREAYMLGMSRLRNSGEDAYYPIILETNPSSKSNWVYRNIIQGSEEIYRHPDNTWWVLHKTIEYDFAKHVKRKINVVTFNTTTFANPHFPKSNLAHMLKAYSPTEIDRLVYGEWNSNEGRVIENYTLYEHPKDLITHAKRYSRILLGCDPAQDTPTAVIFIGLAGETIEVFDEFYAKEKSVRKVFREIRTRILSWGLQGRELQIFIDPSASGWMAEWMEIEGQTIYPYKAYHQGRDPAMNRAVRIGEKLRVRKLIVSDLCRWLIHDFENTVYKKGAKEQIDKDSHDPHALDALGYGLFELF